MRKMAYCKRCQKRRKLVVDMGLVATYHPDSGWCSVDAVGYIIVFCRGCGSEVTLPDEDREELEAVAEKTAYNL